MGASSYVRAIFLEIEFGRGGFIASCILFHTYYFTYSHDSHNSHHV